MTLLDILDQLEGFNSQKSTGNNLGIDEGVDDYDDCEHYYCEHTNKMRYNLLRCVKALGPMPMRALTHTAAHLILSMFPDCLALHPEFRVGRRAVRAVRVRFETFRPSGSHGTHL